MSKEQKMLLDGAWRIAILHNAEFKALGATPATCKAVEAAGAIDAVVPGNFELDMQRAGLIEDPFFGSNPLKMQAYEDVHVVYARTFTYEPQAGTEPVLVFDGIDTIGDVYLNGKLIGHAENMFLQQTFAAEGLRTGENELVVHLLPVCLETRENSVSAGHFALDYSYETLRLRKASHTFAWDIMPRLVSAGLFRSVNLWHRPVRRIKQAYLMTTDVDVAREKATLDLFFDFELGDDLLDGYAVRVEGRCGDSYFTASRRLWFVNGKLRRIAVDNAKLWWPRGYGAPNLYDVTVSLEKDGQVVDSLSFRTGLRMVQLFRTSLTDEKRSGDFHFEVNGKRVFLNGTNWVPVDAYHSRDLERIPQIMEMVTDTNCNVIRCWGGNVYEAELLYNLCDELGIAVWQDFALACGIYPIDEEFQRVLRDEAIAIVRQLRHHPSIILWSGDNECDEFMQVAGYGRNPNINLLTRETLPNVVLFEDPVRPFLPSSPYMDDNAWQADNCYLPENHLWGPRDYFKGPFYGDALTHFVSEIGYHGCPSVESLKNFISPENLWPWQDNDEWRIHASSPETDPDGPYVYRIELMAKQIREMFGSIPDNLEDFVLASQISQAEAKKYFIEMFRYGQPQRSGIIWWNLMDGWPQFSDAVVDYYFGKKLAYDYIKISQSPLILTFSEPHDWFLRLVAVNNTGAPASFSYTVTDYMTGAAVAQGKASCDDQAVFELEQLPYSQGEKHLYVIEWSAGEFSGCNHYMAGNPPFDFAWYKGFLQNVYGK